MKTKAKISVFMAALALTSLALAGCASSINSQAKAEKAAEIFGIGPTAAKAGNASATAKTIMAIDALEARGSDSSFSWSSQNGGSISFTYLSDESAMPQTEETISGFAITNWSLTYTDLVVKDSEGQSYTLNGTVYARIAASLSPLGFNFILTSTNTKIDSKSLSDSCDFDYAINVTSSGYTCSGTFCGFEISNSFSLSSD